MEIILNGKSYKASSGKTLANLIDSLNLDGPVAAQVNEEIIQRDRLKGYELHEGDQVELLGIMGGG
ncbi:MAG TPA: sulfur carrier protein ThiS [Nitrospinota bacterium]|nr:sulfur carrier protein ThiS [Nitrospinota bacterium]|tara:strand:+ start:4327 stop:4524 length:198 start_codon:yes stop_codon:yes gene_type:complete